MTAEQLIDLYLSEQPTKGMKNAYAKRMEARYKCTECGSVIPKYEGRYPGKCPECGSLELEDLQNCPRYSESFNEQSHSQIVKQYLGKPVGGAKKGYAAYDFSRTDNPKELIKRAIAALKKAGFDASASGMSTLKVKLKEQSDSDFARIRRSERDRRAMNAQMRRIPQDRIPLGGPQYYEL